jgi:hypothetical protein
MTRYYPSLHLRHTRDRVHVFPAPDRQEGVYGLSHMRRFRTPSHETERFPARPYLMSFWVLPLVLRYMRG